MKKEYEARVKKYETALQKDNLIFNLIGYIKLVFVLAMGFLIYHMFAKGFPFNDIVLFGAFLVILILLWVYHNRMYDRINYSKGQISICNRQIDRITGKWMLFEDSGLEFSDSEHAYAADLDIVGNKSLFQFLNTTNTWHGRQQFANDLLHSDYEKQEIQKRQKAVSELSSDIDFTNNIMYYLAQIKVDSSAGDLVNELKDKTPFIKNKFINLLFTWLPVLTLIFMAGIVILRQNNLYLIGVVILALQAIIWILGGSRAQKCIGAMSRLPYKLSSYSAVIDILLSKEFTSDKLNNIKAQLETASQAIKDLGKIEAKLSVKGNGLIYLALNVLLWWDYECAILLSEWKRKYADLSENWFLTIGEFESLLCFSHLPNVCDNTCLPNILVNGNEVDGSDMGHPLLPNGVRVNNSFSLQDRILIISGSNMSGKTTFLRTVGVNLVLARTGGFVCAKQMSCSLLEPITSMRISDNLGEGISTFYAELKRVKRIIDFARAKKNTFFLIDEIFRGTNSTDRFTGAKTVIKMLHQSGVAGLLSTHDLELCELEGKYRRIGNYNFSERYENNKILFDYKMKTGKSSTTNAEYLMKLVGIT